VSAESGRNEVFIRSLSEPGVKRPISIEGAIDPRWRGDGKELFYYSSKGQLMAVPINAGQTLDVGKAVPLFTPGLVNGLTSSCPERRV
jgi:eukaryotic-like serine/threonine-protein kinase